MSGRRQCTLELDFGLTGLVGHLNFPAEGLFVVVLIDGQVTERAAMVAVPQDLKTGYYDRHPPLDAQFDLRRRPDQSQLTWTWEASPEWVFAPEPPASRGKLV